MLPSNTLHLLEQVLPKHIDVNLCLSKRYVACSVLILGELGSEISHVHKHANGCQVSVDCLILILSISLNAVKNLHEVLLTEEPDVVIDD